MIRPPEEAVEAAAKVLRREDWRLSANAYARIALSSEPVRELVETLIDGLVSLDPESNTRWSAMARDLIRRWTQEERA